MELIREIVKMIVEALLGALPRLVQDTARKVEADEESRAERERALKAFADFEGIDL